MQKGGGRRGRDEEQSGRKEGRRRERGEKEKGRERYKFKCYIALNS